MNQITTLYEQLLSGEAITRVQAMALLDSPLEPLCEAADQLRRHFCGEVFDICTIINARSGRCSENCKYCAQSSAYQTPAETYPLLPAEKIVEQAVRDAESGIYRFSIVTSGKRLAEAEVSRLTGAIAEIRERTALGVCGSLGLLDETAFTTLYQAGMDRAHNNLESSRRHFADVCSTHTFDDKIESLCAARRAGLSLCSGGIMGLGETMVDRVDMALTLRELNVKSVPVNLLNPIAGTPYQHHPILTNEEMRRVVAIYRFILPDAAIRLAGGRGLLSDKGRACFRSGANAAISGDMLTTAGISAQKDIDMVSQLGYQPGRLHG